MNPTGYEKKFYSRREYELEKVCEHEFIDIVNEKVSGVKMCVHCKEIEIG